MEFSSEPVVSIKNASIYQDDALILRDISFDIAKGEFVYLIGKTGSGKTSLLKTLYADLTTVTGEIKVAGFNIHKIKKSHIPSLRRKVGIIFQDFQLLFDRSVIENLIFVMRATGWRDNAKTRQHLNDILMRVGLSGIGNKLPHQLSGGEQQRVVIARALVNEPIILIADEPTGNLDPEVAESIIQLFQEINKTGTAILMATHNHTFLNKHPARVLKVTEEKVLDSTKEYFSFYHA
jgi:cell division transport system ATP-binding protein